MDIASLAIGMAASFLAVILGVLSLANYVAKRAKRIVREVLTETGVIRFIHPDHDVREFWDMWPGEHKTPSMGSTPAYAGSRNTTTGGEHGRD